MFGTSEQLADCYSPRMFVSKRTGRVVHRKKRVGSRWASHKRSHVRKRPKPVRARLYPLEDYRDDDSCYSSSEYEHEYQQRLVREEAAN